MQSWHFERWLPDVARATIITILYVAGMAARLWNSFLYGGGLVGAFPFIFALILGPWAAAWVACKAVPSDRRLIAVLAAGTYLGLILFLVLLYAVSGLTPEWRLGAPPSRLTEHDEAFLFVAGLLLCVFAGTLTLSRWKSRNTT